MVDNTFEDTPTLALEEETKDSELESLIAFIE